MNLRKYLAFLPVTDGFQQKWDAILFNAERNLVELLLVETDSIIKKLELNFNKELKRQFPDSIQENRLLIKKKHQPYKKQLRIRRRKKMAKFKDLHKYSKPVRADELHIASTKNLKLSKNEHFVLQVGNEEINANGTKEEESHSSYQNQQKYSLVTDNRKQREKRKTYAEAVKEDFRNGMKETREGVVSDTERNTGMRDNKVMPTKLWIVTKKIVVSLVGLNQIFRKFTRICCFLSKLTPQKCFQHPLHLIQTHLLLIMLAIAVLEVHVHLQLCHWIRMMGRF